MITNDNIHDFVNKYTGGQKYLLPDFLREVPIERRFMPPFDFESEENEFDEYNLKPSSVVIPTAGGGGRGMRHHRKTKKHPHCRGKKRATRKNYT